MRTGKYKRDFKCKDRQRPEVYSRLKAKLASLPVETLDFAKIVAMAQIARVSSQWLWKQALERGAKPREPGRVRVLTDELIDEAYSLVYTEGWRLSDVARSMGVNIAVLHKAMCRWKEKLDDLAAQANAEAKRRATRALPVASSPFLRALTKAELLTGKSARPPRSRPWALPPDPAPIDSPT